MPSFPTAGVSQVFGLLDILRSYNGKTDVAKLNIDLRLDIDDLLPIIDTAEFVGLVTVTDGDISLTEVGKKLLSRSMEIRKKIVGEQLMKTELYSLLSKTLQKRRRLKRSSIAETIEKKAGPMREIDAIVNYVIRWGVFSDIFGYEEGSVTQFPPGSPP